VVEHLGNARAWARRYGFGIPFEDRLSIAHEAICEAAAGKPPDFVTFSGWAKLCVQRRLIDESRRWEVWGRHNRTERAEDLAAALDRDCHITRIETRELAELFRCRFYLLSTHQRKLLEMFCIGYDWPEIQKKLKLSPQSVYHSRKIATEKLLNPRAFLDRRAACGTGRKSQGVTPH